MAAAAFLLLAASGCATHRPPPGEPAAPNGTRILYKAESRTPEGRNHFRVAAAIRPPDHLRLEILGPVGGPRLVLATDGSEAIAIDTARRRYDRVAATAEALARITGLPLDAAGLIAALRGRVACADGGTAEAAAGDPGVVGCRLGDATYMTEGSVGTWPMTLTIGLPRLPGSIRLLLVDGPADAVLGDELFSTAPPSGFAPAEILGGPGRPAFFSGDAPVAGGAPQ